MVSPKVEDFIFDIIAEKTSRAWFAIDRNYKIVFANAAAHSILNKTPGELVGYKLPELFYKGKIKALNGTYFGPLCQTLETGEELCEKEVFIHTDGNRANAWCLVNTFIKRDTDGQPKYVLGSYVPIDKFKAIEGRLDLLNMNVIKAFSKAIGARDAYTMRHVENVSTLMVGLAEYLQFPAEQAALAYLAAVVHDIGKIGIPEHILNKPGRLTTEEYEVMKRHAQIGSEILEEIDGFAPISDIVKHHHERYDGCGYPGGLAHDNIPLFSRMLAICDSYDAMTSARCYRTPFTVEQSLTEINRCSGTQFDPEISKSFAEFVQMNKSAYRGFKGDRLGRNVPG
jgi:putative nucleotidyltransferase with HDIG domain/PAS domain S-box-containing protein